MSELRRQQIGTFNLGDVSDVTVGTPVVDQVLKYNGSGWIPGAQTSASAGNGVDFYLDDTNIIAASTQNAFEVNALTKTPITTTEVLDSTTLTNTTVIKEAYLYNSALGRTQLDAGIWRPSTYASINTITGVGTAEVITSIKNVVPDSVNTVTITGGSGTTRTATASGGTPFAAGDANADATLAGYLQTPKGAYQITAYTSPTVVTITVPAAYIDESAVSFSVWKHVFNMTTGNITTTSLALYEGFPMVEPSIPTALTDKLAAIYFAKSTYTSSKIVTFSHNGSSHYSNFHAPLVTLHDDLAGLYGTSATENYGHIGFGAQSIYGLKTLVLAGVSGANQNVLEVWNEAQGLDLTNTISSFAFYQRPGSGGSIKQIGRLGYICENTCQNDSTFDVGVFLDVCRAGVLFAGIYIDKDRKATFYKSVTMDVASGEAILKINQGSVAKYYTGFNVQRQGVEKYFVGMNSTTDDLIFVRDATTVDFKIDYATGDATFNGAITATTVDKTYAVQINSTHGLAVFGINQNNATKYYAGFNVQRQGVEKYFVGMNSTTDDLIFRRTASTNDLTIIATNGDCVFNRSVSLHETGDSMTPGAGYSSFNVDTSGVLKFTKNHGGVTTNYTVNLTAI